MHLVKMKLLYAILIGLCLVGWQLPAQVSNDDCIGCHSDKDIEAETARGKKLKLHVSNDSLKGSVHEGMECLDCHTAKNMSAFEDLPHGSKENPIQLKCQECHEDTHTLFTTSDIHGILRLKGNKNVPSCAACHGSHQILSHEDPKSRMSRQLQPLVCGKCHGKDDFNEAQGILRRGMVTKYKSSVHFKAIEAGKKGASCTDCHNHHTIQPAKFENSTVKRSAITKMCSNCHEKQSRDYLISSHGQALEHGSYDVPNCTSCHGDHDMVSIKGRKDIQWISFQQCVCMNCHENDRMMARYGLDTVPVKSYKKDYHGLARMGSSTDSALCSHCHDPHKALP